jgi:hypothetical protein
MKLYQRGRIWPKHKCLKKGEIFKDMKNLPMGEHFQNKEIYLDTAKEFIAS